MEFWARLRRLTRHQAFRRLLSVRITAQTGDGIVQVGMASYVLFSPQNAPNAAAIATVLAITLLPFSIVGPFVSVALDRWSRQRIAMVTDGARAALCLTIAALIATDSTTGWGQVALFGLLLVTISLNRFMLAGLSAGLPRTVDDDEYLSASSIMPMIGPAGLLVGGLVAGGVRFGLSALGLATSQADGVVFCAAAATFLLSVTFASRIPVRGLGPDAGSHGKSVAEVWRGLRAALTYLHSRRPVVLGLTAVIVQRITYGLLMVTTILAYRNHFHGPSDLGAAMVDLGVWFGITGAGYVLSGVFAPILSGRLGVRGAIIACLATSAVVQAVPGSIFTRPTLVIAGFVLGLCAQSMKVCVDTVTQAHTDDDFRGRVFVIYDMVFNSALVAGAVLGAFLAPEQGLSLPIYLGMAAVFALVAIWFTLASRPLGAEVFDQGTRTSPAEN